MRPRAPADAGRGEPARALPHDPAERLAVRRAAPRRPQRRDAPVLPARPDQCRPRRLGRVHHRGPGRLQRPPGRHPHAGRRAGVDRVRRRRRGEHRRLRGGRARRPGHAAHRGRGAPPGAVPVLVARRRELHRPPRPGHRQPRRRRRRHARADRQRRVVPRPQGRAGPGALAVGLRDRQEEVPVRLRVRRPPGVVLGLELRLPRGRGGGPGRHGVPRPVPHHRRRRQ